MWCKRRAASSAPKTHVISHNSGIRGLNRGGRRSKAVVSHTSSARSCVSLRAALSGPVCGNLTISNVHPSSSLPLPLFHQRDVIVTNTVDTQSKDIFEFTMLPLRLKNSCRALPNSTHISLHAFLEHNGVIRGDNSAARHKYAIFALDPPLKDNSQITITLRTSYGRKRICWSFATKTSVNQSGLFEHIRPLKILRGLNFSSFRGF